jgi:excisionase family DNA binding protein
MTTEEVAQYLRVAERTVRAQALRGELPGIRIGTLWRFRKRDLDLHLESRVQSSLPVTRASNGGSNERET